MSFLAVASLFALQASTSTLPPDYSQASSWLCLPGKDSLCTTPLATTALNPNGYGSTGPSPVARNPSIDCFYVYPTMSRDAGMNSDLNPAAARKRRPSSASSPVSPEPAGRSRPSTGK